MSNKKAKQARQEARTNGTEEQKHRPPINRIFTGELVKFYRELEASVPEDSMTNIVVASDRHGSIRHQVVFDQFALYGRVAEVAHYQAQYLVSLYIVCSFAGRQGRSEFRMPTSVYFKRVADQLQDVVGQNDVILLGEQGACYITINPNKVGIEWVLNLDYEPFDGDITQVNSLSFFAGSVA